MNLFGDILTLILQAGETVAPIFIHSPKGIMVLNASEELAATLANIAQTVATQKQTKSVNEPVSKG